MAIPGYVREVEPGEFPDRDFPSDFRLVVVDEIAWSQAQKGSWLSWRLATPDRRCRYTIGPGRQQCRASAVVELLRGLTRPTWWGYCGRSEHLFGRTWDAENKRLLDAVLVPLSEVP